MPISSTRAGIIAILSGIVIEITPVLARAAEIEVPVGRRQLFLDDYVVAELQGLKRTLHQPRKLGAVIRGSTPSETIQIRTAPVWDKDANVYKLWILGS